MNYEDDTLKNAVKAVRDGKLSFRAAAAVKFSVPKSTIERHLNKEDLKKQGGQTRLTAQTELSIVRLVIALVNWRVLVNTEDLRDLVKSYLDTQGVNDRCFKNNIPGYEWAKGFIKRHNLTTRFADNVKSSKLKISQDDV